MTVQNRINAFSELGQKIKSWLTDHESQKLNPLSEVVEQAFYRNGWFVETQVISALHEISSWLNKTDLRNWVAPYDFDGLKEIKTVGVIMAGNIPLVGYHDYLSVVISGHKLRAKLSSKDEVLLKFLHEELLKIAPELDEMVDFSKERFTGVDAVIATGSDNTSRYFEYYFSKIPHIIRKNRTSIAILSGNETKEELTNLGNDIFRYFGLGCRNVTKVYFPKGFDLNWFYEGVLPHSEVINNHKYQNNYDYHKSVFMLNRDEIWDNNFLILKKEKSLSSPVGTLYYEEYDDLEQLNKDLTFIEDQIQCKVGLGNMPLGGAQSPKLNDYSDNIDVLNFLLYI